MCVAAIFVVFCLSIEIHILIISSTFPPSCYINSNDLLIYLYFVLSLNIALATTYKVNVITSKEFGSGTDANVYIIIFGKNNDTGTISFVHRIILFIILITGIVPLRTSKTHKDPFERGHTDVFEIEAIDIGEPTKIKYE